MHKHFADWYREIGLVPTPELLEKRATAINKIVKDIDENKLFGLVCTFNHGGHCSPQFGEQFAQYFLDVDTTFPMRKNQNELRVLAGACLAEMFGSAGEFAVLAAACVVSGSFGTSSSEPPYLDVANEAASKLASASLEVRARIQYPKMPSYGPELETALQDLRTKTPANNVAQVQLTTPIIEGLIKTESMLIELAQRSREFVEQAQHRMEALAEECNVLWWLFSGHSHDMGVAFAGVDEKALPVIVGKELADLITDLPGPASVEAILAKAIQVARKEKAASGNTISNTVNSLQLSWRTKSAGNYRRNSSAFPCIFPLHFAIGLAADLDSSPWDKAFLKKVDHFKPELVLPATRIAYQSYLESLILRRLDV